MQPPYTQYPRNYRPPEAGLNFDVIGEAWRIFQNNWRPYVQAAAVTLGISIIFVGLGLVFLIPVYMGSIAQDDPTQASFWILLGAQMLVSLAMSIVLTGVYAVMAAGFIRMTLAGLDGTPVEFENFTSAFRGNMKDLVVAGLLQGLCVGLATQCCSLFGLPVAGLLLLAVPLVSERGLPPVAAIQESWSRMKPVWLTATLLYLVAYLIGGLGALACLVGVLFTIPLTYIIIALVYRDVVLRPELAYADAPVAPTMPWMPTPGTVAPPPGSWPEDSGGTPNPGDETPPPANR